MFIIVMVMPRNIVSYITCMFYVLFKRKLLSLKLTSLFILATLLPSFVYIVLWLLITTSSIRLSYALFRFEALVIL